VKEPFRVGYRREDIIKGKKQHEKKQWGKEKSDLGVEKLEKRRRTK
jgi:hypothetical protein